MELTNLSDDEKNQLVPVPHPEFEECWPSTFALSLENLLILHRIIPLWIFRGRLNFMSHESMWKYFYYSVKAFFLNPGVR